MGKHLATAIKAAIGIAIVSFLVYKIGAQDVYDIVKSTSPLAFFIIAIGYLLNALLNSASFYLILSSLGVHSGYRGIFLSFIKSWGIGSVLPGKVGDLSVVYFLKKEGIDAKYSSAMYVIDKMAVLLFFVIIAMITAWILLPVNAVYILAVFLLAAVVGFLLFIRFGKAIIREVFGKYAHYIESFHTNIRLVTKKPLLILILFIISSLRWLVLSFSMWLLLSMANEHVSFIYVFLFSVTANILALLPVTVSGIGLKEAAFVYLYGLVGATTSIVLAVSIVYSIITIVLALIAVLFAWEEVISTRRKK
ncbi:MAG: lysylphosphatidylglycerol synthase transmembrane domain-containing protein [Nanoarchaeota archaeon]|nr:lysylphosphatidylglycerol synthase transmembrane domain-containing protein [Nanoarchaeota archaeon]